MTNETQRIVPNLWINNAAERAAGLYAEAFPETYFEVESRYPTEGLLDFQTPFAGEPLTVAVSIRDCPVTLINAGDEMVPNPSNSLTVNFDPLFFVGKGDVDEYQAARDALTHAWDTLKEGGAELMPLGEYPFSPLYGWVQDKYGISWQLILTDPHGPERPFIMPTLLFGGEAQNRAKEAVDFYLEVFPDSELGELFLYEDPQGPATAGSVQFCDFRLGESWLVVMDSGANRDESFTGGLSHEVRCSDQEEIDHFWSTLSANPNAEVCGWLEDKFGVSWQIVPENMDELMEKPGAYQKLMGMKKIVIEDF